MNLVLNVGDEAKETFTECNQLRPIVERYFNQMPDALLPLNGFKGFSVVFRSRLPVNIIGVIF